MSTQNKIEAIRILASKLPSGLIDPKAMDKLNAEWQELDEAIETDAIDAIAECCDIAYYAIKAEASGLISEVERNSVINQALIYISLIIVIDVNTLLLLTIEKYQLRARPGNPKDHKEERAVIVAEINRSNLGVKVCQYCGRIGKPESHLACQEEVTLNLRYCDTIEEAAYFLDRAREIDPGVKSHFSFE